MSRLLEFLDEHVLGVLLAAGLAYLGFALITAVERCGSDARAEHAFHYSVETFTESLTIRIECTGDCDLAAMKAEARKAAH